MMTKQIMHLQKVQSIIQNNMSIAASIAERVYRCPAKTSLRPKCWFNCELEVPLVDYLWISLFEPDIRRDDAPIEDIHRFQKTSDPGCSFQMSDVALYGSDEKGVAWR